MSLRRPIAVASLVLISLAAVAGRAWAAGNDRKVAFGLQDVCTGCHGFPPGDPEVENYPGGAGAHKKHVDFLTSKLGLAAGSFSYGLCSPCHGANPGGSAWHAEAGIPAAWTWPPATQVKVDIIDGAGNYKSAGATNTPTYSGVPVLTTQGARGGGTQECANLTCHGPGTAPAKVKPTGKTLTWAQADRSVACAGCHGSTASTPTGLGASGEPQTKLVVGAYTSALGAQGVSASYYGTPSGYGAGGHGDSKIEGNDPGGDESYCRSVAKGGSGACAPPLACTECHRDPTVAEHFTGLAGKSHFLRAPFEGPPPMLENTTAGSGLCTRCHTQMTDLNHALPAGHHPSDIAFARAYLEPSGVNYDVVPPGTQGDVDSFVMYWTNTLYTAIGSPAQVNLPRFDDVFPGQAKKLSCITCHQPHGTDLALDVGSGNPLGNYTGFPNHMLRLRDEDKTLCKACHKD